MNRFVRGIIVKKNESATLLIVVRAKENRVDSV